VKQIAFGFRLYELSYGDAPLVTDIYLDGFKAILLHFDPKVVKKTGISLQNLSVPSVGLKKEKCHHADRTNRCD
jgi:hypothetical protein